MGNPNRLKFQCPSQPQLESALNAMANEIAKAKSSVKFSAGSGLTVTASGDEVCYSLSGKEAALKHPERFKVVYSRDEQKIFISVGAVVRHSESCVVSDSGGDKSVLVPVVPTLGGLALDAFATRPYFTLAALNALPGEGRIMVVVPNTSATPQVKLVARDSERDSLSDGEIGYCIADLLYDSEDEDVDITQLWQSDIYVAAEPLNSTSGSGGSGGSIGGSIGGSTEGSSGSSASIGGSEKDTAIVPASWSPSGYAALFVAEMPEVRFDDVMVVALDGHRTTLPMDKRFVEVCEAKSIRCCGWSGDRPGSVGVVVSEGSVVITASCFPFLRPQTVTLRLSGVRKGFRGKRFPFRTRKQFDENEAFINSAYSK